MGNTVERDQKPTMSRLAILALLISVIAISNCCHTIVANAEPIRGTKQVVLKRDTQDQPDPVSDCEYCAEDINKAIADCDDIPPDDQHALYRCIEDGLIAAADCIVCICEMMGIIAGVDIEPCH